MIVSLKALQAKAAGADAPAAEVVWHDGAKHYVLGCLIDGEHVELSEKGIEIMSAKKKARKVETIEGTATVVDETLVGDLLGDD